MYLIHAHFSHACRIPLPAEAAQLIRDGCEEQGIEHAVVHPTAEGNDSLVGLFVLAGSVEEAENLAARACRRALAGHAELAGFTLASCDVRLVPDFYDQQFRPGPDGRDMPGPN
ncbi:hypothetical protein ACFVWY_29310 [Streptomyces sp. NPDC058195]|uniref:hypothetical protein n=1 Tax=Streptomyces sp. NPDC058195 TaxID=3346375 RepID=UPI0036E5ED73